MEEFDVIETYLRHGDYPNGITKDEKANLRRKCRNNYKFNEGILYYKKKTDTTEEDAFRVCIRSDDDMLRVLESCHAGMEGNKLVSYNYNFN